MDPLSARVTRRQLFDGSGTTPQSGGDNVELVVLVGVAVVVEVEVVLLVVGSVMEVEVVEVVVLGTVVVVGEGVAQSTPLQPGAQAHV
jgi:hypothetical protein